MLINCTETSPILNKLFGLDNSQYYNSYGNYYSNGPSYNAGYLNSGYYPTAYGDNQRNHRTRSDGARRYKQICSVINSNGFLNPNGVPKCPY